MKAWNISLAAVGLAFGAMQFGQVVTQQNAELDARIASFKDKKALTWDKPRAVTAASPISNETITAKISPQVNALFHQLPTLPAGDAAIAIAQQLEAGITEHNRSTYVDQLLRTDHPGVERATLAALSRSADSATITSLVSQYGSTAPERRGRILQVLENAQNPAATEALIETVAMDQSEKRSPILVSAMNGLANIGSVDSVSALLHQVTTDNETFAYMALERVRSEQGREMIRSAAQGSKDAPNLRSDQVVVLTRIASVSN